MSERKKRRVIYDCDNTMGKPLSEIDDGLTLLYLLGRPELDVVGVTTTFGNGTVGDALRCTQRLLSELDRPEIPVFAGAREAGDDNTDAVAFLAETVTGAPGEIDVLATGPLGNIAGAARRDAGFFAAVRQLSCMGGYLHKPFRVGSRDLDELNLSADADASQSVLTTGAAATRVALFCGHVCLQAPFAATHLAELSSRTLWPAERVELVARWLSHFGSRYGVPHFFLWDLLPAVWLTHPELFEVREMACASGVDDLREGLVRVSESGAPFTLVTAITDMPVFYEVLFSSWGRV
ncbi:MAG: nucleoside hydrolase [Deltaproteobacteria bacterium]|nr:nucleoside hydrolase [Deltaproteobacteria bacterium]